MSKSKHGKGDDANVVEIIHITNIHADEVYEFYSSNNVIQIEIERLRKVIFPDTEKEIHYINFSFN